MGFEIAAWVECRLTESLSFKEPAHRRDATRISLPYVRRTSWPLRQHSVVNLLILRSEPVAPELDLGIACARVELECCPTSFNLMTFAGPHLCIWHRADA
jgi:hypothetical protein